MFLIDMGLLSNCLVCCDQLLKILITLGPMGYLDQILRTYFNIVQPLDKDGEGLPSNVRRCILVIMLITLEPHAIC